MKVLFSLFLLFIFSFASVKETPAVKIRPDYSQEKFWIGLPWRHDIADTVPAGCLSKEDQANAQVDVFYVHPTVYLSGKEWNADLSDKRINTKSNNCVLYQATPFNACARVFAPRYRQAILRTFTQDDPQGPPALDTAYADVKKAFEYYLAHWNKGRPLILAGHSQGARHVARLLKEFFEGKPLRKQLVAAYVIGGQIPANEFADIPPGDSASQTGCFMLWNSVAWGTEEKGSYEHYKGCACVNPLSWKRDTDFVAASMNHGGVPFGFSKAEPAICGAKVHDGVLWLQPASRHSLDGYYHLAASYHLSDVNLFYMNIRENAILRVQAYLKRNGN